MDGYAWKEPGERVLLQKLNKVVFAAVCHTTITKLGWNRLVSLLSTGVTRGHLPFPVRFLPSFPPTCTLTPRRAAQLSHLLKATCPPAPAPETFLLAGGFGSLQLSFLALIPSPSLSFSRGNRGAPQGLVFISTLASCQGSATWSQGCICYRND